MFHNLLRGRFSVLASFIAIFVFTSFLIRTGFLLSSVHKVDFSLSGLLHIYLLGFIYDIGVSLFLTVIYNVYLLFLPSHWANTLINRIITYSGLLFILLIVFFSFFAEITFWLEFESRLNFIAVDYLIYTYEVINNINESYPLPLLIGGVLTLVILVVLLLSRMKVFRYAFHSVPSFKQRLSVSGILLALTIAHLFLLSNSDAESSTNRYENELSKAGIYSFFAAFRSNELNYNDFYVTLSINKAYKIIRNELITQNDTFLKSGHSIERMIGNSGAVYKPNVIMITVESLSADFMTHFGNTQKLMPVLDSLADQDLLFTNMYATGTRTVRGMEALSLSIPPTPGNSIVRRAGNENLSSVGQIFERQGYDRTFYYGGDGYFDNMNQYFGSNGFNITDRGRKVTPGDTYYTRRTIIKDREVHFENAWGVCDEDLFDAVMRGSVADFKAGRPFFNFVMTTSNHRPYTFPAGKITLKQGSREAAVRYTDYAIGEFLKKLRKKIWYKNTVIVIVADHCAKSAGKNEIDISKYHIPCIFLNLPVKHKKIFNGICSQIDVYPTLFGLLGWHYESNLYGQDVFKKSYQPRALLGTYQKLAYLRADSLVILGPERKVETFIYNKVNNEQIPAKLPEALTDKAVAYYQTAYDLFRSGGLHQ